MTARYRSDRDVIASMGASMSAMGMYLVLAFFAAQFVTFFSWSNMGTVMAIVAASSLQDAGLTGSGIFIAFILICACVNLMLGSASAQWAATAPIFVPMLMLLGYSPEIIQAAYRISDSVSNLITPMMSYFGLVLALACRYRSDIRIGTMIAMMLPYSAAFTVGWSTLFYIWAFVLGLPVGTAAPTYYP